MIFMKKILKWSGIIVVGFFVLMVIIGLASGGQKGGSVNNAFQKGMDAGKQTVEGNSQSTTPEQKIEAKVRGSVSDSKKIKDIQVTKQVNGGYGVLVTINAGDNLSNDLIKKGIWLDMATIYTALYKEPMEVNEVAIVANLDGVDKYGKTSNQVVMKTSLAKEEAQKVNWSADHSSLGLQILPGVWTTELNRLK